MFIEVHWLLQQKNESADMQEIERKIKLYMSF